MYRKKDPHFNNPGSHLHTNQIMFRRSEEGITNKVKMTVVIMSSQGH